MDYSNVVKNLIIPNPNANKLILSEIIKTSIKQTINSFIPILSNLNEFDDKESLLER